MNRLFVCLFVFFPSSFVVKILDHYHRSRKMPRCFVPMRGVFVCLVLIRITLTCCWRRRFQVRVLEVVPGSPSHIAGLKPEEDYLLGTAERVFKDPNILLDEVTAHLDQPMAFYVYNTKTDEVREYLIYCWVTCATH